MQPSEYVNAMTDRQLASLLYRDEIHLKHSSRERLEVELVGQKQLEDEILQLQPPKPHAELDPMLKALLDHMKQAPSS